MRFNWKRIGTALVIGVIVVFLLVNIIFTRNSIPQYETFTPAHRDIEKLVDFTAYIYPHKFAQIDLGSKQEVRKVRVSEGQRVKKGQILAQLDDSEEKEQLASAQSSYNFALASQNSLDSMQDQLVSAREAVAAKKIRSLLKGQVIMIQNRDYSQSSEGSSSLDLGGLDISNFSSDSSGLAGATSEMPSSVQTSGQIKVDHPTSGNYILIANMSQFKLWPLLSEEDIIGVKKGQKARLVVDAKKSTGIGKVIRVYQVPVNLGQSSPEYYVGLSVKKLNPPARIGMTVDGEIIVEESQNALVVPMDGVFYNLDDQAYVKRLINKEEGIIEEVEVSIGIEDKDYTEIIEGIDEGETLVTKINSYKKVWRLRPWIKNLFTKNQ